MDLQKMPNGGFKVRPEGNLNSQYKGGLVTNYEWMKIQCEEGKSLSQIAILSDRSKRTVVRWLLKHNLETKKIKRHLSGKDHPNYNGATFCNCGNRKSFGTKTCSGCYSKKLIGKGNPNYKGINDIMSIVRSRISNDWRILVYERDLYTCQKCGDDRGGNLEAHHIKTLSSIVSNIIKNNNDNFDCLIENICNNIEVLSIDNGITLCKSCHKNLHKGSRKENYLI